MNVLLIDDHEIVWNGTRRLMERLSAKSIPTSYSALRRSAMSQRRRNCRRAASTWCC
jgi:hypothetical protein